MSQSETESTESTKPDIPFTPEIKITPTLLFSHCLIQNVVMVSLLGVYFFILVINFIVIEQHYKECSTISCVSANKSYYEFTILVVVCSFGSIFTLTKTTMSFLIFKDSTEYIKRVYAYFEFCVGIFVAIGLIGTALCPSVVGNDFLTTMHLLFAGVFFFVGVVNNLGMVFGYYKAKNSFIRGVGFLGFCKSLVLIILCCVFFGIKFIGWAGVYLSYWWNIATLIVEFLIILLIQADYMLFQYLIDIDELKLMDKLIEKINEMKKNYAALAKEKEVELSEKKVDEKEHVVDKEGIQ